METLKLRSVTLIWENKDGKREVQNFGLGDETVLVDVDFAEKWRLVEITAPDTAMIKVEEVRS